MIELEADFSEYEQYGDMDDGLLVLHDSSGENADVRYERVETHNATLDGDTEVLERESDSREKLEADVRQILHSAYMFAWMHGNENRRGSSFEKLHVEFYNLLDRQAAITEHENERTCECVAEHASSPIDGKTIVLHRCSACHELMRPTMPYCPNCGAKVVGE